MNFIVGLWQLSEGHRREPRDRADVMDLLGRLVDEGFTTFDCADIYTGVEELLGEFRTGYVARHGSAAADRLRIHTKFVPDRDVLSTIDRSYVERIIDRSLRRLNVEQLDLVQFAWWDYAVPRYVETARWLDELRQAGKIRELGVTNFDVPRLREIVEAGVPIAAQQVQYSLLDRRPEHGMATFCEEHDIRLFCYGTLAGGFLSDRYRGAEDPRPPLANRSLTKYRLMIDEAGGWERVQGLLEILAWIAERAGGTIAQIALQWVLDRPSVTAALVGISGASTMRDGRDALQSGLSSDGVALLRTWGEAGAMPGGDVFGLERESGSPHAAIMKYDLNQDRTPS
jgi:aryl-alcohol dehydrogenase-like predicted oxidoreductase